MWCSTIRLKPHVFNVTKLLFYKTQKLVFQEIILQICRKVAEICMAYNCIWILRSQIWLLWLLFTVSNKKCLIRLHDKSKCILNFMHIAEESSVKIVVVVMLVHFGKEMDVASFCLIHTLQNSLTHCRTLIEGLWRQTFIMFASIFTSIGRMTCCEVGLLASRNLISNSWIPSSVFSSCLSYVIIEIHTSIYNIQFGSRFKDLHVMNGIIEISNTEVTKYL